MRRALWLVAALSVCTVGCAGSLRPSILLASARSEYPDCEEVVIAERAQGVRQWLVICGERRLFGLRSEEAVARERQERGLGEDDEFLEVLEDQGPSLEWVIAPETSWSHSGPSVVAWLRPRRVAVTLLGVGDETSYVRVEAPAHPDCVVAPALWFGAQRQSLDSAPTEAVIENTWSFTQRIDCLALKRLASEPVELSYCGHRYAFDTATARALHDWAAARDSRACVKE